jgi:hypothetical protein
LNPPAGQEQASSGPDVSLRNPHSAFRNKKTAARVVLARAAVKRQKNLRRDCDYAESLGEWRGSGVLLHVPFGDPGHPGIIGPAVGILAEGFFQMVPSSHRP